MSKLRETFHIKNIGRTFVTACLASGPYDIRVGETIGPFDIMEQTEHLNRLRESGVIAIIDNCPAASKPAPRMSQSKTKPEDTGNGK